MFKGRVPGRRISRCKGPEARVCLLCPETGETSVDKTEAERE